MGNQHTKKIQYINSSKTKIFKRFMWSRTAGLISKTIEKSNIGSTTRNMAYKVGAPNKPKLKEWEEREAEGQLSDIEKNELKTAKEIYIESKNHPILIKTGENNEAKAYGYLTHAPKAPKNEGGQKYIEISKPTDSEPQYLNSTEPKKITSNLFNFGRTIATDNSPEESRIDKEIKKHEKI